MAGLSPLPLLPPISHRFVGATWYPQVQALPLGSLAGLLSGVR